MISFYLVSHFLTLIQGLSGNNAIYKFLNLSNLNRLFLRNLSYQNSVVTCCLFLDFILIDVGVEGDGVPVETQDHA